MCLRIFFLSIQNKYAIALHSMPSLRQSRDVVPLDSFHLFTFLSLLIAEMNAAFERIGVVGLVGGWVGNLVNFLEVRDGICTVLLN